MKCSNRPEMWRSTMAVVSILIAVLAASPATADDVDLTSDIIGSAEVAQPGEIVTYSVVYGNLGPGVPSSSAVNLDIPPGVPALIPDITVDQIDAIEASLTDTFGNPIGVFASSFCDALLIQVQNDLQPANVRGKFSVDIPMPMDNARTGVFIVHDPPSIAGDYDIASLGSCDDGFDIDCETYSTCFGPPLATVDAITAPLRVVDDGTADATLGCNPLLNDMTGTIAMVRRGACEFGLKSINAEQAGALAVAIVNDRPGDLLGGMGAGAFGTLISIPVLMLYQDAGEDILAVLEGGGESTATEGGIETEVVTVKSLAFHAAGSPDVDPDPGNDADEFATALPFFADGFESGDTVAWTLTVP